MDEKVSVTRRVRGKDLLPRTRRVRKLSKEKEAFKSFKEYIKLEKQYNKTKRLLEIYPKGASARRITRAMLRDIRKKQYKHYKVIARNDMVSRLSGTLGVSRISLFRRGQAVANKLERKERNG